MSNEVQILIRITSKQVMLTVLCIYINLRLHAMSLLWSRLVQATVVSKVSEVCKVRNTEQLDREAQAHMAIVFLAPTEIYFAALDPDSLSHTEPSHPTSKE